MQSPNPHWITSLRHAARSATPWDVDPAALRCGLDEAYALQAEHLRQLLADADDAVVGTKLSVTNEAALARLGLAAPLLGPILRSRCHANGATLRRDAFLACIIEAEIGLQLGADLDGRHGMPSRGTLRASIAAVFPAIEIADSRYARWAEAPAHAIVADLAYAGAWVRGTDCPLWPALDLDALPVVLSRDGRPEREGHGSAVLGDPLHALARAVADAGARRQILRAGTLVSTGACTVPWPLAGTGRLRADFGALGQVDMVLR
jgi:2-keto-4-pentenoate hydratase